MTLTHLSLRVVCLLGWLLCAGCAAAVRFGEYSVGRVAQYDDQYGDRSPDAPARLDYKYEEEHGRSDDLPVKDVVDERIWDKPIKKKRKPPVIPSGPIGDIDKYSLDETEPELKSDKRFVMRRPQFRKRDFARLSDSQRHLKHDAIDHSDDIDSMESNRDYLHKQDGETADPEELSHVRYRASKARKPRRKPRDRALFPEWRESRSDAKLEQGDVDVRLEREDLETKNLRRFEGSIQQQDMKRKKQDSYVYDDYYDMKRVQHMRSRLPALLRHTTVRTTEAKSASPSGHWVIRRADTPSTSTGPPPSTLSTTATAPTTTTTARKTSDLSLAEKSRLSILKKAQRKENARNVSASTKPPVLMQVTRKMQTMVMVEPRPPETALRAREVLDDSPERLRRARRLIRHKLVAGARSIHELTDDWDQMVCDYIDVSVLDTDAALCVHVDACLLVPAWSLLLLWLLTLFINN